MDTLKKEHSTYNAPPGTGLSFAVMRLQIEALTKTPLPVISMIDIGHTSHGLVQLLREIDRPVNTWLRVGRKWNPTAHPATTKQEPWYLRFNTR